LQDSSVDIVIIDGPVGAPLIYGAVKSNFKMTKTMGSVIENSMRLIKLNQNRNFIWFTKYYLESSFSNFPHTMPDRLLLQAARKIKMSNKGA
jgi:hypothetical protein